MRGPLADAWDAGYKAGRAGKPVVKVPAVKKSRWETAYALGADSVAEATAKALQSLAVEIDGYLRSPGSERLRTVKQGLAKVREALSARKPPAGDT